ncbi:MAG: ATP-binding protein [Labilithrix sp.]
MTSDQGQLRLHRTLLLSAGGAYLGWWGFVHLALPKAFNPFASRAAVVAIFFALWLASRVWRSVAARIDVWFALACSVATVHYFYLFDRNDGDLDWVVGSYITVTAVCALMQTSRSLVLYSVAVAALSTVLVFRPSGTTYVVFVPGMLTTLVFANVGLQSRLRLSHQLRELFEAGFDGIAVHEAGVIREVNGVLGPLLGRSKDDLIGRDVTSLFPPDVRPLAEDMVKRGRETSFEADLAREDGSRVMVEVMGKQHQLAFRDVTARKEAEAALLRANRDLEAFSYSVAHDLRAPIRSIGSFSRIVLEDYADVLDADGKRHLERIAGGADTMAKLVEALLELARVTRVQIRRDTVNLSDQADSIMKELRAAQPERDVTFESDPDIIAEADADLVRAVLDNLLRNAWKFTGSRPRAHIRFGHEEIDGVPVYFVRDDGVGFDMSKATKLFVPFQRLHSSKEYAGTGIGLATVQRIIDRHAGRVWAESAVNEGTTLFFTLRATRGSSVTE